MLEVVRRAAVFRAGGSSAGSAVLSGSGMSGVGGSGSGPGDGSGWDGRRVRPRADGRAWPAKSDQNAAPGGTSWAQSGHAPTSSCRELGSRNIDRWVGFDRSAVHIVVVGCGRVGSELAGLLEKSGHTVAVVDKRPEAFRRLPKGFGGTTIVGFGFDRDILIEARIDEAGAVAAVTSGDNSNIMSARVARETFGIERVVARIYDPRRAVDLPAARHPDRRDGLAGPPTRSCAGSCPTSTTAEWVDPTSQVCLVERDLPAAWAGRKLAELAEPGRFTLVSITRTGTRPHRDSASSSGRRATSSISSSPPPISTRSTNGSTVATSREATTDARRHRRRRQRRPVHRQRAGRQRPRGAPARAGPRRSRRA